MENIEAKNWIIENWVGIDDATQDGIFAGHVFNTKEEALKFIDTLYEFGAKKILIAEVKGYSQNEPDRPYADSIIVELPEDNESRLKIFSFLNTSEPDEHFEESGQKTITVFWDY